MLAFNLAIWGNGRGRGCRAGPSSLVVDPGISLTAATAALLLGRTHLGAVRTVDAAVSRLWPQEFSTGFTVVEILAGIRRHGLHLLVVALRTGDRGLQVSRRGTHIFLLVVLVVVYSVTV